LSSRDGYSVRDQPSPRRAHERADRRTALSLADGGRHGHTLDSQVALSYVLTFATGFVAITFALVVRTWAFLGAPTTVISQRREVHAIGPITQASPGLRPGLYLIGTSRDYTNIAIVSAYILIK
jgi:hypothetical protein